MDFNDMTLAAILGLDPSDLAAPIDTSPTPVEHGVARGLAAAEMAPVAQTTQPAWLVADMEGVRTPLDDETIMRDAIRARPDFVPVDFSKRSSPLQLRRWSADSRVAVVATTATRVQRVGAAAYLPGLGWVLPAGRRASAVLFEQDSVGYCVVNDNGAVNVFELTADALRRAEEPAYPPRTATWLEGVAVAPWLTSFLAARAGTDDGYEHAVMAGLIARFALADSTGDLDDVLMGLTSSGPTPAVQVAAWASAAPAAWLRDRRIDIDTQLDAIEELMSEAELAGEDPDAPEGLASVLATRASELREHVEAVVSVLVASGDETALELCTGIDRAGIAQVGTAIHQSRARSELLRAVGRLMPEAWWGQLETDD